MKATEAKLLDFLKKSPQFVIPIYQRTYSWTERECQQLWDDILRTGKDDGIAAHFVGSIVYIEQGLYQVSSQSPLLVIDGQQRLTTVMLILETLARQLGETEPLEGFSAEKLRNYYLLNPFEKGEQGFKLLLTQTDKNTLLSLMKQTVPPPEQSTRIAANFDFFQRHVSAIQAQGNIIDLCKGLAKLMIVDISLSRDQDKPQLIFESMNSTGRELSQADLIRNFVLMSLEPHHQNRLYEEQWRPIEVTFGQEAYGTHFDRFMRHYLTVKTRDIPNIRSVYEAFKRYAHGLEKAGLGIDTIIAEIRKYADYYCAMALDMEEHRDLSQAFRDLRELKVDVAYPFLLELYADYAREILSAEDFVQAVRLVESYVFRRAVCAIATSSLNKTFATFGRGLHKDHYLESIQALFLTLPSYRRFPNDEEFKLDLCRRDLYNFPRRSYWLRRIENHERKEHVPVDEYTIEHILPQNENLSVAWREALGSEWESVQKTFVHTLGNLTLTGYNPEYGDRAFADKRDMRGGFRESPLRLNKGLGALPDWNETTIRERAEQLSTHAVKVWKRPSPMAVELSTRQPEFDLSTDYTLDSHAHLIEGAPMRSLFEEFRKRVLALDPCVREEILKVYIAFKAETNFVDVVALKSRLRLSLNMQFHELHDPKGVARDVTNIGRWGNGDVEVVLSDTQDMAYVMGLVRQAFEIQMGDAGGET